MSSTQLLEEITAFCASESLSEDGLREIIGRHGAAPNDDPSINNYDFFHWACRNERLTDGILRYLLKYFPNAVRHAGERGRLPLHIICRNKNVTLGMVQLLIDAYPDSIHHETNSGGWIPLYLLCDNENLDDEIGLEILKLLVERCPESVRHATGNGSLPIHYAAQNQSPEFCRVLIEAYPGSERIADNFSLLPFHYACECNTVATAKYLFELYPESINVADRNGAHPIHHAIWSLQTRSNPKDGIEVVKVLLECNPDVLGATEQTPLHIACRIKRVTQSVIQLLIDAFPDSVRHEDNNGLLPLHRFFCSKNDLDGQVALKILTLLVERCPESVRHATRNGNLPLHIAAMNQSPEFCRILIEAYPGSERITRDDGILPFHRACVCNTVATAEYLYQLYPESINVANNDGWYPIHYAIRGLKLRKDNPEAAIEIVRFLIDCDPNVVLQECNGNTPFIHLYHWMNQNEDTRKLNAYLKVLHILYDLYPGAIESNEVTSNVTSFHREIQTFINTQLTYARQARDHTLMTTPDENGQLPLHKALCDNAILGSIKLLVKGNPSAVQTSDSDGALPLHLACLHYDCARIVEYLVNLDPSTLHAFDGGGNTALHYACRGANHAIISLLLEKYDGASISKRNVHNQLPIDLLCESEAVSDKESIEYTESIFRLIRAYPDTVL